MVDVGDRVAYAAHFLRSISADFDTAERRGVVEEIRPQRHTDLARVRWEDTPGELQSVLVTNIARVGSAAFGDPHVKPS